MQNWQNYVIPCNPRIGCHTSVPQRIAEQKPRTVIPPGLSSLLEIVIVVELTCLI